MSTRVLVVDDSGFFRRRVAEILEADPLLTVIGQAANGQEAIDKTAELKPDVITMDIEMPVMDGITATRKIMAATPTPIIMFSSLTTEGAKATLDALDAGALDFLPKRFEDISNDREEAKHLLCQRVRTLGLQKYAVKRIASAKPTLTGATARSAAAVTAKTVVPSKPVTAVPISKSGGISIVAIGTSTGGPLALQTVLTALPENFSCPVVLVQHMPGSFTPAFAKRLDQMCAISVKEAEDGEAIKPGVAYLAPGGKQMLIEKRAGKEQIRVIDADASQTYKPSVDITFTSIANVYPGKTLAIVLTGMGADGREGTRKLKSVGAEVWVQDEASCVVYGMPAAVHDAGLSDKVLGLDQIGQAIVSRV